MAQEQPVDLYALSDLATPWCVRVVATLGIAELIETGVTALDDLAARTHSDPWVLQRVLRTLIERGVFLEPQPGIYALNEAARGFLSPGLQLYFNLDGLGGRFAHSWGTLLDYVRSGQPQYAGVFGRPFWEDLEANPELSEQFDALIGPTGHGIPDPAILLNDDWQDVRHVVDVGGGSGALLAEILRVHADTRGTLVDLPSTAARATETFAAAGVTERVIISPQSFFDPLPPGADLYVLKSILNDWPDAETVRILARCAEAAGPQGRVVILGGVAGTDGAGGLMIEMILLGGKTRPLEEFRGLAASVGLTVVAAGTSPSGRYIVECRPA